MAENAIHKSTAKKILNKLNPAHHKDKENHSNGPDDTAEVHHSSEVTDDVKPLVEQTNHVHSQTKHPTVESCASFLIPPPTSPLCAAGVMHQVSPTIFNCHNAAIVHICLKHPSFMAKVQAAIVACMMERNPVKRAYISLSRHAPLLLISPQASAA